MSLTPSKTEVKKFDKQLSLSECAMADAQRKGRDAVLELEAKRIERKRKPKHTGTRTNVGDPMRGQSSKKAGAK